MRFSLSTTALALGAALSLAAPLGCASPTATEPRLRHVHGGGAVDGRWRATSVDVSLTIELYQNAAATAVIATITSVVYHGGTDDAVISSDAAGTFETRALHLTMQDTHFGAAHHFDATLVDDTTLVGNLEGFLPSSFRRY